jgi:uncharacterized protein (TIGR03118 family)
MKKTRTSALVVLVAAPAMAMVFDGCGDDTTSPSPTDASVNDVTNTVDGTTGVDATSGTDGASADGGTGDASTLISQNVTETKLFANSTEGGAMNVDPGLVNPWGLVFNPTGVAWVSDNHSGVLTAYPPGAAAPAVVVSVSAPMDAGPGAPTGQVFNPTGTDFAGDKFIAATEDGTIAGWQTGTVATLRVDNSAKNAIYKGLAIVPTAPTTLVAADFHNGKIDVFDNTYALVTPDAGAGKWTDPSIPAGYAPYNVAAIGTSVYVSYAKQDANKQDDIPGDGFGAISVFDTSGTLTKSLVAVGGALDAPWGMAQAPAGGFGSIPAGALLVGNFGDGTISAFDAMSGAQIGVLAAAGKPMLIEGLWGLAFGKDVDGGDAGESSKQLYFTAGSNGENDGLFGYLTAQ